MQPKSIVRRFAGHAAVLTGSLLLAGCWAAEITAPSADASKTANANQQAHAIHVRVTSRPFGTEVVDMYTFTATRHGADVNGKFYLYQIRRGPEPTSAEEIVVIASGPVVCMRAEGTSLGGKARVGGVIDYTTFPEGLPIGSELTWSVTDNGRSANADDTASEALGNIARVYCESGLSYAEQPVERGKVQVRP